MASMAATGRNETTETVDRAQTRMGLAVARFTIGAMFVWVFFENLRKGLYTTAVWKAVIISSTFVAPLHRQVKDGSPEVIKTILALDDASATGYRKYGVGGA
jgi:hypothetical protein